MRAVASDMSSLSVPREPAPDAATIRLLRESASALRESAADHDYRAQAMRAIRDRTLAYYHQGRTDYLFDLADSLDSLTAAAVRQRTQALRRRRLAASE